MAKDYINLDFPPGIRSNGTPYSNRGAWIDGSRIRWADNALRPIGGWERFEINGQYLDPLFADGSVEAARAVLPWRLNDGANMYAAGSNMGLYAWGNLSTTPAVITPYDFSPRLKQPTAPTGYGNWFYGTASYGTERHYDEAEESAFSWTLKTWGQNLLAAPNGAPSSLYEWEPSLSNRAVMVEEAPSDFDCFHVTPQRIAMTAGAGDEPRIVKWSDSENIRDWEPRADNKAGFQTLPGVGRFRAFAQLRDVVLIVSETDVYAATYVGAPFVFGFQPLGDNCGTPSPLAVVSNGNFVMWPGHTAFFMCDGNTVRQVPCDVMDKFAGSLNRSAASKTVGFVNPFWTEIWWLYQSGADDIDSYIFYDWQNNYWSHGKLERTAAAGYAVVGGLIMVSPQGQVYRHELPSVLPIDNSADEVFALSGPVEMAKGNRVQYVKSIQPDFISQGAVKVTLIGQDRPGGPEVSFGPYTIDYPAKSSQPVPARARGHTVKVKIEGLENSWTLGSMRLDFNLGGEK